MPKAARFAAVSLLLPAFLLGTVALATVAWCAARIETRADGWLRRIEARWAKLSRWVHRDE